MKLGQDADFVGPPVMPTEFVGPPSGLGPVTTLNTPGEMSVFFTGQPEPSTTPDWLSTVGSWLQPFTAIATGVARAIAPAPAQAIPGALTHQQTAAILAQQAALRAQQQAAISPQTWLMIGGVAILALALLKGNR